ncbi:MAG: His/Gly/Thr/Pro-type tRNA ligase C-terminal domain-containing protein [Lentisphaeria bacterium]|nr:His/Gly/Thr/Pro-type tRNA ligase C-terminal domain-containing protein [Lentisphaeria bacterium]
MNSFFKKILTNQFDVYTLNSSLLKQVLTLLSQLQITMCEKGELFPYFEYDFFALKVASYRDIHEVWYEAQDGFSLPIFQFSKDICYLLTSNLHEIALHQGKGGLPAFIAETQIVILPVHEGLMDYIEFTKHHLNSLRAKIDTNFSLSLGERIALNSNNKIPLLILVGDEEKKRKSLQLRFRKETNSQTCQFDDFLEWLDQKPFEQNFLSSEHFVNLRNRCKN